MALFDDDNVDVDVDVPVIVLISGVDANTLLKEGPKNADVERNKDRAILPEEADFKEWDLIVVGL